MTLLRFIQRASILAGMTLTGFSFHSDPSRADDGQFCVTASNGKTACGKIKIIERLCVTTDGNNSICGKFKSFKPTGEEASTPSKPSQGAIARKEVNNIVYLLKGCRKSDTSVKCELVLTNKAAERNFQIDGNSYSSIVDYNGKSYSTCSIDLGGKSGSNRNISIAPGIDYVAIITFKNIPEQVTKAALLNLDSDGKKIQFRSVPFSN
jgi:hypothetical protein